MIFRPGFDELGFPAAYAASISKPEQDKNVKKKPSN